MVNAVFVREKSSKKETVIQTKASVNKKLILSNLRLKQNYYQLLMCLFGPPTEIVPNEGKQKQATLCKVVPEWIYIQMNQWFEVC